MPPFRNPFLDTDFAQGGGQRGLGEPPGPEAPRPSVPGEFDYERLGTQGATPPYGTDPATQLARAQQRLVQLRQAPAYRDEIIEIEGAPTVTKKEGQLDPMFQLELKAAQAEVDFWQAKLMGDETYARNRADKLADYQQQLTDKRDDRAVTQQATGASIAASQEATRRQGLQQEWQTGEAETQRGFTAGESALNREFTAGESALNRQAGTENIQLTNQLGGERERAQREFDAQENALNRQLQKMQIDIQAGRLNLETALGTLEKWLQAYPSSLPEGAQYTPGFQPGGAFEQASALAGVGYSPERYRANPVPFNPADVVRQTMGR